MAGKGADHAVKADKGHTMKRKSRPPIEIFGLIQWLVKLR